MPTYRIDLAIIAIFYIDKAIIAIIADGLNLNLSGSFKIIGDHLPDLFQS